MERKKIAQYYDFKERQKHFESILNPEKRKELYPSGIPIECRNLQKSGEHAIAIFLVFPKNMTREDTLFLASSLSVQIDKALPNLLQDVNESLSNLITHLKIEAEKELAEVTLDIKGEITV